MDRETVDGVSESIATTQEGRKMKNVDKKMLKLQIMQLAEAHASRHSTDDIKQSYRWMKRKIIGKKAK